MIWSAPLRVTEHAGDELAEAVEEISRRAGFGNGNLGNLDGLVEDLQLAIERYRASRAAEVLARQVDSPDRQGAT